MRPSSRPGHQMALEQKKYIYIYIERESISSQFVFHWKGEAFDLFTQIGPKETDKDGMVETSAIQETVIYSVRASGKH